MKKIIVTIGLVTSLMFGFIACDKSEVAPISKESRLKEAKKLLTAHKWNLTIVNYYDSLGVNKIENVQEDTCSKFVSDITFDVNGNLIGGSRCKEKVRLNGIVGKYKVFIDDKSNVMLDWKEDYGKNGFLSESTLMKVNVLTDSTIQLEAYDSEFGPTIMNAVK